MPPIELVPANCGVTESSATVPLGQPAQADDLLLVAAGHSAQVFLDQWVAALPAAGWTLLALPTGTRRHALLTRRLTAGQTSVTPLPPVSFPDPPRSSFVTLRGASRSNPFAAVQNPAEEIQATTTLSSGELAAPGSGTLVSFFRVLQTSAGLSPQGAQASVLHNAQAYSEAWTLQPAPGWQTVRSTVLVNALGFGNTGAWTASVIVRQDARGGLAMIV